MKGFLTRTLCSSLIFAGLAPFAFAQTTTETNVRGAYFVPAPQEPAHAVRPVLSEQADKPLSPAVLSPVVIDPVASSSLPKVSSESFGMADGEGLGADMWEGTDRSVAEWLLSQALPSRSPTLNDLVRRLLRTAAVPPEGTVSPRLTSLRVEKLVAFGAAGQAWALAKQADQRLVSDSARRAAALNAFLGGDEAVCGQVADSFKIRSNRDWQKLMIVCRLQARDNKAAQVALDILRSENGRDKLFLSVADRNILGSSKTLPAALSPTDPEVLALLQMTGLGLPESFFARADLSDARALLGVPARDDVVRLRLAERAAERGLIGAADLESVYRAAKFPDAAFAAPLASAEKEVRLRALLFQAADRQKDPVQKTALVAAFVRSASAPFLNGAGDVVARMLGDVAADPSMAKDAAVLARVYMLSGAKAARDWVDLARDNALCADEMRRFWPQFVLAGLVKDRAYASDFSKWFSASMKVSDARAVRESIAPTLLLLDASGREVPDAAWQAVYDAAGGEEKISLSPLLFERMLAASAAHRRAETVLMAAVLTKGTEVSLTASIGVVSALREAGLETEAAAFARETAAVLALEK